MSEAYPTLFSPFRLGGVELPNRIAMAPLTRQMAEPDGTPTAEMAAYYARRARGGCGLIITEGVYEEDALGCRAYLSQPGIANAKHVAGWRKVTDAVHRHGAAIILQLMHGGRVSDPRCLAPGQQPVSASATRSEGWTLYTDNDYEKTIRNIEGPWPKVTFGPARELSVAEIGEVVNGLADGARRAMEAGFDGVEIHGANGYLLYQFIHPKTNLRTDAFGGSPENNVRIAAMACEAVRKAVGGGKIVTLRLSQDGVDDFTGAWPGGVGYAAAVGKALRGCGADALHWSSFNYLDNRDASSPVPMPTVLREASGLPLITNGGIADGTQAEAALTSGAADLVAIGRPLFAQPDWPYIVRSGMPYSWAEFDRKYVIRPPVDYAIDYPTMLTDPQWTTNA
jgi:2,4-dienoyl-CoA reductase-like NADH-dependent reductase (Old Yellow Enzyme family)